MPPFKEFDMERVPSVSEFVKRYGFKSLKEYSEFVGVPVTTLRDWHKSKHKLFLILLGGAVSLKDKHDKK